MEVEKRSSKGGFLHLFEWNVKSRKKLFSNKSDLRENSKHGNENLDSLAISGHQQMKLHENMQGSIQRGNDYASSVNNDEAGGTKAPGVVAKLMGLDSLPTSDASEPSFTPFIDSHSFRRAHHSRIITEFESDHHSLEYGMPNKLDGFPWNPVEDKFQKLQNRPIERFQTEMLPPKSAKSIPITHYRQLSPIKSPGFILTRNAAYIMEASSKIIEQSPQSTLNGRLSSFGSSSVPLRIRDLRDKMEAAKKISNVPEASQRPKEHSSVISSKSQPRDKCPSESEIVLLKQGAAGNLNKNKSVSLATQAKVNLQKGDATTSHKRSTMNQKEDDVKPSQMDKKQRSTPRSLQNRSTTSRTSEVLRQNNRKQNCVAGKDRSSMKPKVPYQQDRLAASANGSSREIKTSKKAVENSALGIRKLHSVTSETGKELSSLKTKNFSGKKKPIDGNLIFDGIATNNVVIKEKERPVRCNITIEGSSKWDSVDRKNGMDVVSFTFNSPIKKAVAEYELPAQSGVRCRSLIRDLEDDRSDLKSSDFPNFGLPVIDSDALSVLLEQKLKETSQCDLVKGSLIRDLKDDRPGLKTSELPTFGLPVIDSDALSVLLEQKLKELSSLVETSQCNLVKGSSHGSASTVSDLVPSFDVVNSVSAKHDKRFHSDMKNDPSASQRDEFSLVDRLLMKSEQKWQGVNVMEGGAECNSSRSGNSERVRDLQFQRLSATPDMEPSFSDGSCVTSDSRTTLTSDGSKRCSSAEVHDLSSSISARNFEPSEIEIELQDSASSIPSEQRRVTGSMFEFTSEPKSPHWKLEYIREVVNHAELVPTRKVINFNLFGQLENQKLGSDRNTDELFKLQREVLFDCVSACLEARHEQAFSGSYKEWAKWLTMFQTKDLLADDIYKEISSLTSMEDLMVDELVDKDMSTQRGKWMDFEAEALEEGAEIERRILTSLIDEIVADFMFW